MRLAVLCSLICYCLSFSSFASNLPPEHESARLLLVIEEAVSQGNWQLADANLTQIASLEVELPTPFFYYNGLVHSQLLRYEKAQRSLEHYVVKSGPSGAFYYEALRLLTSIDNKLQQSAGLDSLEQNVVGDQQKDMQGDEQTPLLSSEKRDAYIQTLKTLYLTDSPVQALVMQINSLLSSHHYTGERIKKASEKQGLKFRISIQGDEIILQETKYQNGYPQLSANRLGVSGLDPYINYACEANTLSCWIYHPASEHDVWLTIDYDELVAKELSQAFTRLIQWLQKPKV